MSFYKLAYTTQDGQNIALPPHLTKNSSNDELIAFARSNNCDTAAWENNDDNTIAQHFFKNVGLTPVSIDNPIDDIDWTPFQNALIDEPGLFDYPWDVFEKRINTNLLNAILDDNNQPIATINALAKLNDTLYAELGIPHTDDNPPQVYETGAGWIKSDYRGMGLYTLLRQTILAEAKVKDRLLVSQANGKGASSVNIKDGYTLFNPHDYPFSSTLMGWLPDDEQIKHNETLKDKFILAAGKIVDLPSNGIFTDATIATQNADGKPINQAFLSKHSWPDYHHFWVNNLDKLTRFEQNLRDERGVSSDETLESPEFKAALSEWKKQVAKALFYDVQTLTNLFANHNEHNKWNEFKDSEPDNTAKPAEFTPLTVKFSNVDMATIYDFGTPNSLPPVFNPPEFK